MIPYNREPTISGIPAERYGTVAMTFHWCTVILLIWVGVLGLMHDTWPKRTQAFWINAHALSGLLMWVLVIARLRWRTRHPPPTLTMGIGKSVRRLANVLHWLLYTLMLTIPIIGIVTFIWHGRIFDFDLFQLNFRVRPNRAIFHPTEDLHGYLAYALFTLASAHALAALFHHFVLRDNVLRRMWPSRQS